MVAKKQDDPTEAAIKLLNKQYGDGTLQRGRGTFVEVDAIPTGVPNLDVAVGCGGVPRHRLTEIFGNESGGKTTLCLNIIASCQSDGGEAAFVDAEHALDPDWAEANGVDLDKLLISQPNSGDEALNIVETLVEAGGTDLIVVDSVAALVPQEEIDCDIGVVRPGAQARLISQAMRKLTGKLKKSKCAIVFVNQLREKIGIRFGNPEQTPGGRALKFYSSIRLDVRRKGSLVIKQTKVYGMVAKVKVVKNKVAPPFQSAEFEIHYGQPFQEPKPLRGIYKEDAMVDAAMDVGAVRVGGSFYYPTELMPGRDLKKSFANGRDNFVALVGEDATLFEELKSAVYGVIGNRGKPKDTAEDDSDPSED